MQRGAHAVVIGGSMAGLLAARVLADHFANVTIVERDQFPAEPVARSGVPQDRHGTALPLGYTLRQLQPPAHRMDGAVAGAGAAEYHGNAQASSCGSRRHS